MKKHFIELTLNKILFRIEGTFVFEGFFNGIKKIHFIGIGGVSMSGIAEILHSQGFIIQGSDRSESKITENLKKIGISVFDSHDKNNITDDIDLVVYTVAIKDDNPEFVEAKNKNIKIVDRACILGEIMKVYKYPICISGMHGKTTTTSMLSEVLLQGDLEPTISVGGYFSSINGNFKIGKQDYFVVESCEYFDSFLKFYPYVGIILNIEEDHLDYFKDKNQIVESFGKFADKIPQDGVLVINNSILEKQQVLANTKCKIITFGEDADCTYKNFDNNDGKPSFDIIFKNKNVGRITLGVPGFHNLLNALAVFSACKYLGFEDEFILNGIEKFSGVNRRFQIKGIKNGVTIVDDYAHHPTEISATLAAAKNMNFNKIHCIFQPHTYTRTKLLFDDFVNCFDDADSIIIVDIYAAREKNTLNIHSKDLVDAILKKGKNVIYLDGLEAYQEYFSKNCFHNDVLITMGAGNVNIIGEKILLT